MILITCQRKSPVMWNLNDLKVLPGIHRLMDAQWLLLWGGAMPQKSPLKKEISNRGSRSFEIYIPIFKHLDLSQKAILPKCCCMLNYVKRVECFCLNIVLMVIVATHQKKNRGSTIIPPIATIVWPPSVGEEHQNNHPLLRVDNHRYTPHKSS